MQEDLIFECEFPECGKQFTTKFSLKRHYYIHSRQKTFSCQFCTKTFALPQYLREHQYTHTNQQPFVCGVDGCQESFRQRGKLSLHRRTHETFVKKEYRLLNTCILKPISDEDLNDDYKNLHKRCHNQKEEHLSTDENEKSKDTAKMNVKIQALSQNWVPLKRRRLDEENEVNSYHQDSTLQADNMDQHFIDTSHNATPNQSVELKCDKSDNTIKIYLPEKPKKAEKEETVCHESSKETLVNNISDKYVLISKEELSKLNQSLSNQGKLTVLPPNQLLVNNANYLQQQPFLQSNCQVMPCFPYQVPIQNSNLGMNQVSHLPHQYASNVIPSNQYLSQMMLLQNQRPQFYQPIQNQQFFQGNRDQQNLIDLKQLQQQRQMGFYSQGVSNQQQQVASGQFNNQYKVLLNPQQSTQGPLIGQPFFNQMQSISKAHNFKTQIIQQNNIESVARTQQ